MNNDKQQWLDPAGLDMMLAGLRAKTDILYAPRIGTESKEGAQQKADLALQLANQYTTELINQLNETLAETNATLNETKTKLEDALNRIAELEK